MQLLGVGEENMELVGGKSQGPHPAGAPCRGACACWYTDLGQTGEIMVL